MKVKELIGLLKECDPESDAFISMDVSTSSEDAGHRFYGEIIEVVNNYPKEVPILCEKTEQNFYD